jgi:subtilase family serine protease
VIISRHRRRRLLAVASLAVGLLTVGGVVGSAHAGSVAPVAHRIVVSPDVLGPVALNPNAVTFNCQSRPIDGSAGAPRCYQPSQIQNAYDVTPLLASGVNGTGRTIVIVDAYGSPTLAADLAQFDAVMGLPDPTLTQIAPAGNPPPFDPNDGNIVGWGIETTLDVEWAHAIAPKANIVLAIAASNNDSDILATTKYVVDNNVGDVISQSFGEAESCMDPALLAEQHQVFIEAAQKGMTVFASSGDSGASQPACTGDGALLSASTPASDPNVTGVGGTSLNADPTTGAYIGETAWTEPVFGPCNPPALDPTDINCSGGGFSTLFSRPSFQASTFRGAGHAAGRGVPDVAYNAGVSGGVLIHCGFCNVIFAGLPPTAPVFFIIGGTSAGSPQWAGLAALGDQLAGRRLGMINTALYGIANSKSQYAAAFHDIVTGNNDVAEINAGFDTAPGWDPVTGLGSPDAAALLPLLVKHTS